MVCVCERENQVVECGWGVCEIIRLFCVCVKEGELGCVCVCERESGC